MDETEISTPSPSKVTALDEQLRQLTLAVAELASIQTDLLRNMERTARHNPPLGGVNFGISGATGQAMNSSMDYHKLSSLRSRTQAVLSWLVDRARQP